MPVQRPVRPQHTALDCPRRQSWRRPTAIAFLAGGALALAAPPALAQTPPTVPTVSIARTMGDNEFTELGSAAATQASFTIRISVAPAVDVTVPYAVSGVSVADITATSRTGTVATPAGASSTLLILTAMDDLLIEGNETLTVTLGEQITPAGAAQRSDSNLSAQAVLTDNEQLESFLRDPFPPVANPAFPDEGDSAVVAIRGSPFVPGSFFSLDARLAIDVAITYEISLQGGTSRDDLGELPHEQAPGQENPLRRVVTIDQGRPGAFSEDIVLATTEDAISEGDEAFSVRIVSVAPGEVVSAGMNFGSAPFTIIDNDAELAVERTAPPANANVVEGDAVTFTVRRTRPTISAVTVPYLVSGVDDGDFAHPGAADPDNPLRGSVTIPTGETSAP